jgi:ABC-type nitrate/sulfonate/bicarbonate transport system substrate-binding protein
VFLVVVAGPAFVQLKKIRFSTTPIAVTDLQFKIAQLQGFYRDEGLDLETILIRGAVGLQALLGGSVDYSSAAGALIAAGVRGAPVKLVLDRQCAAQFDLVAQPELKTVAQLRVRLSASRRVAEPCG